MCSGGPPFAGHVGRGQCTMNEGASDKKPQRGGRKILIGKVLKPKGVRGSVKVLSYAESPETFERVRVVYVRSGGAWQPLATERVEKGAPGRTQTVVLAFRGRHRIEEIQDLVGAELYVDKADLPPLEEGEYYWHDLIGMRVRTQQGEDLGRISAIFNTGSNDVYVVRKGGREILLPALRDVIRKVDVSGRRMIVCLLEEL